MKITDEYKILVDEYMSDSEFVGFAHTVLTMESGRFNIPKKEIAQFFFDRPDNFEVLINAYEDDSYRKGA